VGATAISLKNGQVLVAGGTPFNSIYASAYTFLFDVTKNAWLTAASMNVARSAHTATPLADGRVFVAGGDADGAAEIYDSSVNAWSLVASMHQARTDAAAVLTTAGDVLVTGGDVQFVSQHPAFSSVESYSLSSNTWTLRPSVTATLPVVIVSTALPTATLGVNYNARLALNGGSYFYDVDVTGLPPGLSAVAGYGGDWFIQGIPTGIGSFSVGVKETGFNGGSAQATLPLTVDSSGSYALSMTPASWSATYRTGSTTPLTKAVSVTDAGTSLAVALTVSPAQGWLNVVPDSYQSPFTASMSIDPSALTTGNYKGSMSVNNGCATAIFPVSLTVAGALPAPSFVTSNSVLTTGSIAITYPSGYTIDHFAWTIQPTNGTTLSTTSTGLLLTLTPFQLAPGLYHVSVAAVDTDGNQSPQAEEPLNLVQVSEAPSVSMSQVHVYPNPWRSTSTSPLIFDGCPEGATVKIFTISGRLITSLSAVNGTVSWDVKNKAGDNVASGLYLYLITDSHNNQTHGKITIIR